MRRFTSACLALASACLAGALVVAARPEYGGTLRVQMDAAIRSLDPAAAVADAREAAARSRVATQVFEPLVAVDPDGVRPRLATSWAPERRGARWRLQLRSGVVLHDGTRLEAWQVAASLRNIEPAWKISPEGDAVVIDLDIPTMDVPWALADQRHAIVVRGAGGALIGTGPFRLDRTEAARITLRAHDAYWRARPFVDVVQVDTGRGSDAQLADLESGRADLIGVRAVDVRRAARRGSRIESTNPIELVALVFEPHRVSDATLAWRRTIASTLNRDAICSVVLQGHGAPARSLLPAWISGYSSVVASPAGPTLGRAASPAGPTLGRAAVAALAPDLRELALRVDTGDGVTQAIAERIAVDAREAGFAMKIQPAGPLAPRPDVRIVRVPLAAESPDREFARVAAGLTLRGWPAIAPADGAALEAIYRADQAVVDRLVVVPIVYVEEVYAISDRVGLSARPIVNALGGLNLADAWVRGKP